MKLFQIYVIIGLIRSKRRMSYPMKIICQKDLLVEAVSNVSRAVCAKSPIPALEGILLKAEEGTLELTGYDLELGIVTTIESKTEQA